MRLLVFLLLTLVISLDAVPRGGRGGGGRGGGGRFGGGSWGRSSSGRSSSSSWGSRSSSSSYPRQSFTSTGSRGRTSIGGGGFVKPTPVKSVFKPNKFGQTQYSSFSKPSGNYGSYTGSGGKAYGYKAPGGGTNWGTSFSGGHGQYKRGISKKALGLGVAAGFVGGAALGAASTMATYSVYHRFGYKQSHFVMSIL